LLVWAAMAVPILLFLIALVARVVTWALYPEPAYPDAYYYANLARELASGGGFQIEYIWNFVEVGGSLPEEGILPIPSNAHWMPLAALVQVPFIWLLGPTALASSLPFILAAAAVAPLTWFIGRDAGLPRWQAAAAGLLAAFPGGIAAYLGQPDNFAIFMLLGALALWLCARGVRGDRRAYVLGGVVVGLAFLARTDGVLLALPFALAFVHDQLREPRGSRNGWWAAIACALACLIVVAPWLLHQLDVFGSLSPSSAGGRILFISDYRDLYSVSSDTSLEAFLDQGPVALAWSRLGGLAMALIVFTSMPLLFILAPFLIIGIWRHRRDPWFVPWWVYALAFFAFTALVSAVHVPYGTFLHSAVALVPHSYLLALIGIAATVRWVASKRSSWDEQRAVRNFSLMAVAVVIVISSVAPVIVARAWQRERDQRAEVLTTLATSAQPGDRVMSPDAGAYQYHGDWPGIVTPVDPLPVVEEALRLYDVRWLVLESNHITTGALPILRGEIRPEWLSEPVIEVPPLPPEGDEPASDLPRAALYAVCFEPDDRRCDP
jgi:4-amino-4-deoxy-L-arabinose transferase-like glycosyltransferase